MNDTYGHPTGNKVLVHVSKILREALREGDVALRYGGEAAWPDFDTASADALVRRADESLYKAKEEGRNRIVAL